MPEINISLNKDDLTTIILALDGMFRDCEEHRDLMIDMSNKDFEQLRDQMEVGQLLLRFIRTYERLED